MTTTIGQEPRISYVGSVVTSSCTRVVYFLSNMWNGDTHYYLE